MLLKSTIIFFINKLEVIKNILLSLASVFVIIYSVIFYIKIYLNANKIKEINRKIEKEQRELNQAELDNIGPYASIDLTGDMEKIQKSLEQNIQKLRREKEYLLEEISIFKIFKK